MWLCERSVDTGFVSLGACVRIVEDVSEWRLSPRFWVRVHASITEKASRRNYVVRGGIVPRGWCCVLFSWIPAPLFLSSSLRLAIYRELHSS